MLIDYINPHLVQFQVNTINWQDAVRKGGALLINQKICTERYVEACIQAVETMGPYMVISPGIALAHSRPEDGALKIGMSIITLATPVCFGNEANDPVKLLITFCGIDHHSHIGMLQELASFLMDDENQKILLTVKTFNELMDYFKTRKGMD